MSALRGMGLPAALLSATGVVALVTWRYLSARSQKSAEDGGELRVKEEGNVEVISDQDEGESDTFIISEQHEGAKQVSRAGKTQAVSAVQKEVGGTVSQGNDKRVAPDTSSVHKEGMSAGPVRSITPEEKSAGPVTTMTPEKKSAGPVTSMTPGKKKSAGPVTSMTPEKKKSAGPVTTMTPEEKKSAAAPVTSMTPEEKKSAAAAVTSMTPEEKKSAAAAVTSMTPEEKKSAAAAVTSMTPEEEKKSAAAAATSMTPEEEKKSAAAAVTSMTPEEEKKCAAAAVTSMTPEEEKKCAAAAVTSMTPEEEKKSATAAVTSMTPEEEKKSATAAVTSMTQERESAAFPVTSIKSTNSNPAAQEEASVLQGGYRNVESLSIEEHCNASSTQTKEKAPKSPRSSADPPVEKGISDTVSSAEIHHKEKHAPCKQVLVLGLDGSGKTSVLNSIAANKGKLIPTPTEGVNAMCISNGNSKMEFLEIGGSEQLRPYWKMYLSRAFAVIFVVDSADHGRLPLAKRHLHQLIQQDSVLPLIVLANKQDLQNAHHIPEIHAALALSEICENRKLFIIGTYVAKDGSEISSGIQDTKEFLSQLLLENSAEIK
ncbi:uncharacterized protein LOC142649424 [Rhinoderma darwinii]|uniref:uncharacterized protein LOC142649424 n=1 Tax=Rhinoderma darwinii TaxID=43563 RepID=UPI003F67F94C